MSLEDEFRMYVGAYFGILEMDEYELKVYILQKIEEHIRSIVKTYPFFNFDYQKEVEKLENLSLKRKLQDSLLVLNQIHGPMELILLVRKRLQNINREGD